MLKKILISLVVILPLVAFAAKPIVTPDLQIVPENLTQDQQIDYFADIYSVDSKLVSKIIECESGGNHQAIGDGSRSNGVAQFQEPTFIRMEKLSGLELDYKSETDQIQLLSYALSKGWGREWTSYRAIKNGGKYTFYSSQLHKTFTVYCKL